MLRVPVTNARPGMVLALEVLNPHRPDTILLRPNAALDRFNIPRLRELGVREVWICYPGLESLVKYAEPRTVEAYRGLITSVSTTLDTAVVGGGAAIDYYSYRDAVMALLDRLAANPASAALVGELAGGTGPFARHAGYTCFLSVLMGIKLDYYLIRERTRMSAYSAKDLAALGVGAMFHDIGVSRLDPAGLREWAVKRDENDPFWKQHVPLGYNLAKDSLDPAAAGVVLHHHQRMDGSGYPRRKDASGNSVPLAGSQIHVHARITACAELFDRVRYGSHLPGDPDPPPLPAVKALAILRGPPYVKWLDPLVLRTLHSVTPSYPPGSLVTLSNGRRAAVADWSPQEPCRPSVLLIDAPGRRPSLTEERIDLKKRPDLHIASIDGVDVADCNFTLAGLSAKAAA